MGIPGPSVLFILRASLVVYTLAMTVSVTFGFGFTFTNYDTSKNRYDIVISEKGETTIDQKVTSEVAIATSSKNQKCVTKNKTSWLLG
jgi:hypothetical protein